MTVAEPEPLSDAPLTKAEATVAARNIRRDLEMGVLDDECWRCCGTQEVYLDGPVRLPCPECAAPTGTDHVGRPGQQQGDQQWPERTPR